MMTPPPPPPGNQSNRQPGEYEYQKALEKARRDLDKTVTRQDTSVAYETYYWPKTTYELASEDVNRAFSAYGQPPFYHVIIKHKEAQTGYHYDWYVSPASGVIITRDIQKDLAVKTELPLSEIIFHLLTLEVPYAIHLLHSHEAPEKKPSLQEVRTQIIHGQMVNLTCFIQYNVASGETHRVLQRIGNVPNDDAQIICTPNDNNGIALLGTVNFNCLIYLLKTHADELGLQGIQQFCILKVKNIGTASLGVKITFIRK